MNSQELNEKFDQLDFTIRSEERLQDYISGKEVDCIPYNLFGAELIIGENLGYTTSMVSNDFDKYCEIIQIKKDKYGLEDLLVGMGLRTMGQAMGSKMKVPDHGIESVSEFVLEDYGDLNKIKPIDPYNNPVIGPILDQGKELRKIFPDLSIVATLKSSISSAQAIRPIEKIMKDTRKNKEELHELLEICLQSNIECSKAFLDSFKPSRVLISDPVASGNLLSKDQYLEFGLPYFSRLIKAVKEMTGLDSGTHICGYTNHFWEELKDLDLLYFSVDDCESLEEAKNVLGDTMMIVGNVPPVDIFRLGSIDDVLAYCKKSLQVCADSPKGFMLMSGCDVPLSTPIDNIKAFVYAAKTYGTKAQLGQLPKGLFENEEGEK